MVILGRKMRRKGLVEMTVTFQGKKMKLLGTALKSGDCIGSFCLTDCLLRRVYSNEMPGPCLIVSVPSIDTGVCDAEVRRFHQEAGLFPNVHIYVVSMDLPFAQARWCGAQGVSAVTMLSDYRDRSFGQATGTLVEELGLLTRAVFVVNRDHRVVYAEYVPEVTEHPNYAAVLEQLKMLCGC